MKRFLISIALIACTIAPASAESNSVEMAIDHVTPTPAPVWDIDLSGWTYYDLLKLQEKIDLAMDDALDAALSTLPSLPAIPDPLDVTISSVKIGRNSIGSPEIHVVLQNTSSTLTLDRIDFRIKCFDAYGDLIKLYSRYTYASCFYDDSPLKPGAKTPSSHRWTVYDGDGTKSVEIAIEKYHATDGTTVTVPDDQLEWIEFE